MAKRKQQLTYVDIVECVLALVRDHTRPVDLRWDILPVVRDFMKETRDQGVSEAFLRQTIMHETSGLVLYPYEHNGEIQYAVIDVVRIHRVFPMDQVKIPALPDFERKRNRKKPRR
ncbi:MAG: hypothetical protein KW804_01635 [Candidatus Doudnabacteria bacterium]|nr:hypothetical protein [Candidatus Doudnabacteria bacterium]